MRVRLLKPFRAILSTEKEIYINKKLIIKNINLREYLEEKIGENIKINAENMAKLLKELLETFKKNQNIKVGGTHIDLENYDEIDPELIDALIEDNNFKELEEVLKTEESNFNKTRFIKIMIMVEDKYWGDIAIYNDGDIDTNSMQDHIKEDSFVTVLSTEVIKQIIGTEDDIADIYTDLIRELKKKNIIIKNIDEKKLSAKEIAKEFKAKPILRRTNILGRPSI